MKKTVSLFLSIAIMLALASCGSDSGRAQNTEPPTPSPSPTTEATPTETPSEDVPTEVEEKVQLAAGDIIAEGSYVNVGGVEFLYDGKQFQITNTREDSIVFSAYVYGKKSDGTYKFLGVPAFYAIDMEQYEEDLEKDGWAWAERTNEVPPSGLVEATMDSFLSEMDVDKDGYYDISFTIYPQDSGGGISTRNTSESDVFRYKS